MSDTIRDFEPVKFPFNLQKLLDTSMELAAREERRDDYAEADEHLANHYRTVKAPLPFPWRVTLLVAYVAVLGATPAAAAVIYWHSGAIRSFFNL